MDNIRAAVEALELDSDVLHSTVQPKPWLTIRRCGRVVTAGQPWWLLVVVPTWQVDGGKKMTPRVPSPIFSCFS